MPKTAKLTPTSSKLLAAFDDASQDWGWQRDQGSRESTAKSQATYTEADAKLRKRIADLELRIAKTKPAHAALVKAKVALTSKYIRVEGPQGKLIVVENPFYSPVR